MQDDWIIQRLRAAPPSWHDESPKEWFAERQRRGVLDGEGNVLRRMPEPPQESAANGRAAPNGR
jgi:hypothetical protein